MIKTKTWLENTNTKFCVTFDCTPQSVTYGGHTHVGGGTTKRLGIWEGVWLEKVRYKGDDGVWRETKNKTTTLKTSKNGVVLEIEATMQIWTMGYPSRNIPFLYFGNYSKNKKKYMHGYFTDAKPQNPSNYKSNYAKVPNDWTEVYRGWNQKGKGLSDGHWCYKHATQTGGETWNENCYEYRNGTNSNGANGWTSEAGHKPQETRRNMYWIFEKKYTAKVTSSGVVLNPPVPKVEVEYAKGDGGYVTVSHKATSGTGGAWIKLCSWNTRTGHVGTIIDFNQWVEHNNSKRFYVDFVKHCGGESARGSDIKYYAWAKNSAGLLSNTQTDPNKVSANNWVGVHRFNGRPTVPTGIKVTGRDNVYYDKTTFSWNPSTDPDNDAITYDVWIRVTTPNGEILLDKITVNGISTTSYDFNISSYEEKSKIEYWVRSYDGRITSSWSNAMIVIKGEGAKPADVIFPIANSTVYNKRPRILIGTGSFMGSEDQTVKVKWNNVWYDNTSNKEHFSNAPGVSNTIIFKPPTDASVGECTYSVKMNNVYADSKETVITFNITDTPYTTSDIDPYIKINKAHLQNLRTCMNNVKKAYGLRTTSFNEVNGVIKLDDYKTLAKGLNDVNDFINNYNSNDKFDVKINLNTDMKFITDKEWDRIIEALTIV